MTGRGSPIRLAGSELGGVRHVCAFFGSEDEAYRILLPFITDGFSRGDRAIHIVQPDREGAHLQRLEAAGIDLAAARARRQLDLRRNTETYLADGRFDHDKMLASFEAIASGSDRGAFPINRIVCNMEWACDHPARHHDLIEFESRVNEVWRRHDDAVICAYDLTKWSGAAVIDILRTHPMAIVGGVLQVNPFFVSPSTFLRERSDPPPETP